MHVHTQTALTVNQVKAKFASPTDLNNSAGNGRKLAYATDRARPKLFLSGIPVTPPAAAEVYVSEGSQGSDVVLRLMWGPLPAPFPRALAAFAFLLGLLIAYFSAGSIVALVAAALVAALPIAALVYQRQGEKHIQDRLSALLGAANFVPRAH
ncbi:MAG: hypothetical protein ACKVQK_04625 [Burkholderiales bacterium]